MKPTAFLVVDDEPSMQRSLRQVLSNAYGGLVHLAQTNDEAKKILAHHPVDLIISDLIRPGGDGLEFLKSLRASGRYASIPVVVYSGTAPKLELEAWRAGARVVIAKPATVTGLIHAVDEALGTMGDAESALIHMGMETPTLDYKGELPLENKDQRAALAKDVIAFANAGGGQIVVGVTEESPGKFVPTGLSVEAAANLESSVVNRAVRPFLDPPTHVRVRRMEYLGRLYVALDVPGVADSLMLAAKENESANLRKGRIYARTSAAESAEVESSDQLRTLLARLERRERSNDA